MSHAKLGLIGTGRIGSVHASNIAASTEAELAWVADPFVDGAQRVAAATGARATEDPAAAIAAADVDGIIIASPTCARSRSTWTSPASIPWHPWWRPPACPLWWDSIAASTGTSPRLVPG
jgi:hypothetical protein